jgi:D-alanyl-D-alanine carboxypeptidase/D-alanyl-D-alanine-endopeptidase (penicillin-binding protein 4)
MTSNSGKRLRTAGALAATALVLLLCSPSSLRLTFASGKHSSHSRLLQPRKHPVDNSIEGVEIVDAETGAVLTAVNETETFNPASNTKLATSLAVLVKFGPDYRFQTTVRIDGPIDANGVVHGNLYVEGHYMLFGDDEAEELLKILHAKGIDEIDGDLVVSSDFSMNLDKEGLTGGQQLKARLDPAPVRHKKGKHTVVSRASHIDINGTVRVGAAPANSTLLATHNSPPLKHILKRMNCPSDNDMAERLGELIGGPTGLTDFVIHTVGVLPAEVNYIATSGLDDQQNLVHNRISPRAMIKVLQALRAELAKHNLTFADIMAVAGVDQSTLKGRLNAPGQAGSVIGKTGSLPETDNGASALSGEIHTKFGVYLFVIFDMHGDMSTFRSRQNDRVTAFEDSHGGPQPISYKPILPGFTAEAFWQK